MTYTSLWSLIVLCMTSKKVLNWKDMRRYVAIKAQLSVQGLLSLLIHGICTGHVQYFSRPH